MNIHINLCMPAAKKHAKTGDIKNRDFKVCIIISIIHKCESKFFISRVGNCLHEW